ncbi:SpoIIIAH-like family protein [Sporolactobacillus sp. Y61]|jgi:stage III sporulation protein AH|uniref:SpoIIIAH-like family protein n=1 Tax=Sporolactobacillus sp. Y61 TaxID=3160863 RepID=A0AAU8IEK8_9BACL|nr:SpoIIIAH-like family protein [Sporolactobacillus sp. THM19-2]RYL87844.1 SpoIIIAH-like family protein [Sporolactobacillus sp. THM19-2]
MLKKQTVWLLTMLSLIVVLSVYALTAPGQSDDKMADSDPASTEQASTNQDKGASAARVTEDKLGQLQLDKADERSRAQEKYESVIASEKSSAEEVSAAYDDMQALNTLANNERVLEDVIQSKGFEDAVVTTKGSQVQIFVMADKLTGKQANEVIRLANEYLGTGRVVSVSYALNKK